MSLPAMSLGLRFYASRKGKTGGGGWVSTMGWDSIAASGLSYRRSLNGIRWAISLLLCTNGIRKQFSGHVEPSFLTMKLFPWAGGVTTGKSHKHWKLVGKWVWFQPMNLHRVAAVAKWEASKLIWSGNMGPHRHKVIFIEKNSAVIHSPVWLSRNMSIMTRCFLSLHEWLAPKMRCGVEL